MIYELTWKESVESNSSPKRLSQEKKSTKFDVSDSRGHLKETGETVDQEDERKIVDKKEQVDETSRSGREEKRRKRKRSEKISTKDEKNVSSDHYEDEKNDTMHSKPRMHYKVCSRIGKKFDCTLMVVGSNCVILCQKRRLQCINFEGKLEREWTVNSHICYVRLTGGPTGREGLLIGMKDGTIIQIFVSNPFPISIMQVDAAVVCLDLSPNRKQLAVVDERGFCKVFDIREKKLLYEASSVSERINNLCEGKRKRESFVERSSRVKVNLRTINR